MLGQARSTQRHVPVVPADEAALTAALVRLAGQYGRYGYRRITALLRREGWRVNHKRVERIWCGSACNAGPGTEFLNLLIPQGFGRRGGLLPAPTEGYPRRQIR